MITVVMTTYEDGKGFRSSYAIQTADTLFKYMEANEPLKLHIADDGSVNLDFIEAIRNNPSAWPAITLTNAERRGIGASLNIALAQIPEDTMWVYTTDDWTLTHKLDLTRAIKLISQGYDMVRIGPVHPNLTCRTMFNRHVGWWLDINPQNGGFAFGTRPFLATKEFYNKIGPFDEMVNAYEVEKIYCEKVAKSNARIAAMWLHGPWFHIGDYAVGSNSIPEQVNA